MTSRGDPVTNDEIQEQEISKWLHTKRTNPQCEGSSDVDPNARRSQFAFGGRHMSSNVLDFTDEITIPRPKRTKKAAIGPLTLARRFGEGPAAPRIAETRSYPTRKRPRLYDAHFRTDVGRPSR